MQVKIFLIACSIKEAEKLYTALEYRSDNEAMVILTNLPIALGPKAQFVNKSCI